MYVSNSGVFVLEQGGSGAKVSSSISALITGKADGVNKQFATLKILTSTKLKAVRINGYCITNKAVAPGCLAQDSGC